MPRNLYLSVHYLFIKKAKYFLLSLNYHFSLINFWQKYYLHIFTFIFEYKFNARLRLNYCRNLLKTPKNAEKLLAKLNRNSILNRPEIAQFSFKNCIYLQNKIWKYIFVQFVQELTYTIGNTYEVSIYVFKSSIFQILMGPYFRIGHYNFI